MVRENLHDPRLKAFWAGPFHQSGLGGGLIITQHMMKQEERFFSKFQKSCHARDMHRCFREIIRTIGKKARCQRWFLDHVCCRERITVVGDDGRHTGST